MKAISFLVKKIILTPLFVKAGIIAAGIMAIVEAISSLRDDLKRLEGSLSVVNDKTTVTLKTVGMFDQAWNKVKSTIKGVFKSVSNFIKLILVGGVRGLNLFLRLWADWLPSWLTFLVFFGFLIKSGLLHFFAYICI